MQRFLRLDCCPGYGPLLPSGRRRRPPTGPTPSERSLFRLLEHLPIQIYGNTRGLKASQVKQLERLFQRRLQSDRLLTNELARNLTQISHDIRRQVGVLVDRRGDVQHVMVGNNGSTELSDWGRLRAGRGRGGRV